MSDQSDYIVRILDLPPGVGGFVSESPDGVQNVYINARHGWRGQRRAYRHELDHIDHDDLHSDEPLEDIEARAEAAERRLTDIPTLVKARDIRKPTPEEPVTAPPPLTDEAAVPAPLTPRQSAVLLTALSDLDKFLYRETYEY